MSAERFVSYPPGRLEWHPAHEELVRSDPETFVLHVEFVHAHGIPKGEFTTFSNAPSPVGASHGLEGRHGARGK
ncbi:MAG TPA: hypothetical protein VJT10_00955 [Steroidobacteraceae bacterium]|jgi:hypothetical protein|nr:hypothetical protein [Steroidobacteraceae bacterium]